MSSISNASEAIDAERASIRRFMETYKHLLAGRVLDFGSGKQPYRDLVSGEYFAYDKQLVCNNQIVAELADLIGRGDRFDVIMCNQVLQYVDAPSWTLRTMSRLLKPGGKLVMTYATNWREIEPSDKWRFTRAGMEFMLQSSDAGRWIIRNHEERVGLGLPGGFDLMFGYGVVAETRPE